MPPDAVVVLPTYNEVDNLRDVVEGIRRCGASVLVVDGASPDGTGALADELAAADAGIAVLHRTAREGLGPAYAAGFAVAVAGAPFVVCQMDADLSHDPADLPRLIAAIEGGADVAIGSRYVPGGRTEGWSLRRRLLSRSANVYVRLLLGVATRDATAGFRAYRPEVLAALHPETCRASGYAFQVEMTFRAERRGSVIEELPICFTERRRGQSKMSPAIALEAVRLVALWSLRRLWTRLRSAP